MFWTFDIFFSCSTGVVRADGSVEYDMKTILKRYAKTWLAMDLLIAARVENIIKKSGQDGHETAVHGRSHGFCPCFLARLDALR